MKTIMIFIVSHNTTARRCRCPEPVLRAHPSRGLFKETAKVWSPAVSVARVWGEEKRDPQLRGETWAHLMRGMVFRRSLSSLRLWCLSMLNTHSMIQNILKYRTVIIDLQNTHTHVQGIGSLHFFHGGGSQLPRRKNCLKASLSLSSHSDRGSLLSVLPPFVHWAMMTGKQE